MVDENTLLRRNVRELQSQLRDAHIRIAKLNEEIYYLKKKINFQILEMQQQVV